MVRHKEAQDMAPDMNQLIRKTIYEDMKSKIEQMRKEIAETETEGVAEQSWTFEVLVARVSVHQH